MDLLQVSNRMLLQPAVQSIRRPDEFYVTTHCGVEVQEAWGKQVYGACHRAAWYRNRYPSVQESDTPESARKKYWGRAIEEAEINLWKDAGIYVADQVGFWIPEYYLKGRIDCFVRDLDSQYAQNLMNPVAGRGVIGVEIKSTWSYGAQGTIECKTGVKPWPKWEHVIQSAVYHWRFRDFANYWIILYIARDKGTARQHTLVVTENNQISVNGEIVPFTVDHIFARLAELSSKLQSDQPPLRDFHIMHDQAQLKAMADAGVLGKTDTDKVRKGNKIVKGDWQCRYCQYAKECWNGVELPYDTKLDNLLE